METDVRRRLRPVSELNGSASAIVHSSCAPSFLARPAASVREPTEEEIAKGVEVKPLSWTTVAADTNVISASLMALLDGLEYALVQENGLKW